MRIGLLNNLRAGRNRDQVSKLLHFLGNRPEVAHVETSNAQVVPDALWELARQDVELLVVNGGDGTLSHALTEILDAGAFGGRVPHVAVLRGGSTNMTALDLGSDRDPMRSMERLLWAAQTGRVHERVLDRQVLRVQYGPGVNVRYGMFFGAGVIHRGIELVQRHFEKKRQGIFGTSLVTAGLLARCALLGQREGVLEPDKIQILLDRIPVERGESTVVMATSLDRLVLGMRPFWGSGEGNVRFTSIASGAPGLACALPGILAGRPGLQVNEHDGYVSRNAERVDLRLDCGFTVDGELEAPGMERIVSIRSDDRIRFVRA